MDDARPTIPLPANLRKTMQLDTTQDATRIKERHSLGLVTALFAMSLLLASALFILLTYYLARHAVLAWEDPQSHALPSVLFPVLCIVTVAGGLRWTVLLVLSFLSYLRGRGRGAVCGDQWPPVSIFVPAFNEAENIEAALEALRTLDYPNYEVIVVDDGSTDDTFDRARRFAGRHGNCDMHIYRKPNGGKWSAHNFAFRRSVAELVLCLDADSRIDSDSLQKMVRHLVDPNVAAVAGQIRVRNRMNLLTQLQAAEYLLGNGCARMAMSLTGTVLIVAGPLGLFRRCVLEEVYLRFGQISPRTRQHIVGGPFEGDTFAEDFDLSLAILSLGGRIVYEPSAVSHTRAPDWPFAFISQRYRWYRGTVQVLRKYFRRLHSQVIEFDLRLLLWLVGTYIFDLIVLPAVYVGSLGMLFFCVTTEPADPSLVSIAALALLTNFYAAAMFVLVQGDSLKLLPILILYQVYQKFLIGPAWFISLIDELRGTKMRW
jgi:cellulose synthase/poly-beta-1,6-N-acetylglucosamine synthase-like glycosyltransferase